MRTSPRLCCFADVRPIAKADLRTGNAAARGSSAIPAGVPVPDPFRSVSKLVTELRAIRGHLPAGIAG